MADLNRNEGHGLVGVGKVGLILSKGNGRIMWIQLGTGLMQRLIYYSKLLVVRSVLIRIFFSKNHTNSRYP